MDLLHLVPAWKAWVVEGAHVAGAPEPYNNLTDMQFRLLNAAVVGLFVLGQGLLFFWIWKNRRKVFRK